MAPETPRAFKSREKATGRVVMGWRKMAWSKWYWSFDGQSTWNRSRKVAFDSARDSGKLVDW